MKEKSLLKKLTSMRFAIGIIVVLAAVCAAGSFITQGQSFDWYAARYSERIAGLIIALGLDDIFHSPGFVVLSAFLCADLIFCNISRVKQLSARYRAEKDPARAFDGVPQVSASGIADPLQIFKKLGMGEPVKIEPSAGLLTSEEGSGSSANNERAGLSSTKKGLGLFASKNAAGLWGAWVCHLGIILLIAGFALGQFTKSEYTVYGVPGQTKPVGDSGYELSIDDFRIELSGSGSVSQYRSDIRVSPVGGGEGSPSGRPASISVNHPAKLYGMKFYQNSTGWAAKITITKNGEILQQDWLCAGEFVPVEDMPELVIYYNALYSGPTLAPAGPETAAEDNETPAYLYTVYYMGQILGMNALIGDEPLIIDDYVVTFTEPRPYTLIQVKKDSFTGLAFAGGIVTLLGLALAFYVQPSRVWAYEEEGSWTVCGSSPRGGRIFEESFLRAAEAAKGEAAQGCADREGREGEAVPSKSVSEREEDHAQG